MSHSPFAPLLACFGLGKLVTSFRNVMHAIRKQNEPVEEEDLVEVADLRNLMDHCRGIHGACLNLVNAKPKVHNIIIM